jgi:hypothetical protein
VTGCLGTSRGSSRGSSSTTWTTPCVWVPWHVARLVTRLVVDYFNYAAHPGATARRAARHRLLRLRRATKCLGTSRGSSRGSPSTTSTTPRVRVPRHVARPVTRLVVDYSVCRDFVLRPHWLYFSCASRLLVSRLHWLYFEYVACHRDVVFRSYRVDHSSRLVFQISRSHAPDN